MWIFNVVIIWWAEVILGFAIKIKICSTMKIISTIKNLRELNHKLNYNFINLPIIHQGSAKPSQIFYDTKSFISLCLSFIIYTSLSISKYYSCLLFHWYHFNLGFLNYDSLRLRAFNYLFDLQILLDLFMAKEYHTYWSHVTPPQHPSRISTKCCMQYAKK